jgi:glycosyltransferase involved in cell wall biosynthesis
VVVVSNAIAEHYGRNIPAGKLLVSYSGVDGCPRLPTTRAPGPLRLLLLGHQTPNKGSDLAIRAIAACRQQGVSARLRLVGNVQDDFRIQLERLAADLGIREALAFVSFTEDPCEHIAWCDALLMCSKDEAFGRVTAEALKSGRVVIGSRSGATPELVHHGDDGLLFAPGNVDELSAAIIALAEDRQRLSTMMQTARDRNAVRFTRADHVQRVVELCHEVSTGCSNARRGA